LTKLGTLQYVGARDFYHASRFLCAWPSDQEDSSRAAFTSHLDAASADEPDGRADPVEARDGAAAIAALHTHLHTSEYVLT